MAGREIEHERRIPARRVEGGGSAANKGGAQRMDIAGISYVPSLQAPKEYLAVGFEDDSFVVYAIDKNFQPLFRGIGHKAFIC